VKKVPPIDALCANCNHPESAHGKTGTRPCLVMVGDLLARNFCPCDRFQLSLTRAA
jgi:hypothetical protein